MNAYILEAQGTIEERLADLLVRKRTLSQEIILVDEAEKKISREELIALLEEELRQARSGSAD